MPSRSLGFAEPERRAAKRLRHTWYVGKTFPSASASAPRRNAKPFAGIAEPERRAAKRLRHTWYVGENVFASPVVSSTAPYPQELNPWSSHLVGTNSLITGGEE